MNTKLLVACLWIFFLALRNTGDAIWQFCFVYSGILVVCALFYQMENKGIPKGRKKK